MRETIAIQLDCELTVRQLWEYVDSALGEDEMAQIAAHIDACVHCRSHTEFERTLIAQNYDRV